MLPVVRPATLLRTAVVTATLLTALSVWIRIAALDDHDEPGFPSTSRSGLAVAYRLFSTDDEGNVPTWFSAMLLAAIAVTCLGIWLVLRARRAALRRYWAGLAAVFGYLSMDELATVHEELIWQLDHLSERGGAFTFPWVIVAAPLVVVFGLVYLRFLWLIPRRTAGLLVLAGVLYVGGALGMEVGGGSYVGFNLTYVWLTSLEEWLEMVGAGLCLYAVTAYARDLAPEPAGEAPPPAPVQRLDGGRNTANGSVTSMAGETNR